MSAPPFSFSDAMTKMGSTLEKHWGWGVVLGLVVWMSYLTLPHLWLKPTWPNGGDVASHLLYVGAFKEWFLEHGRISGWLPEVYAGFPALTYYFPLPFVLIVLLSLLVGLKLAFKCVVLLPAFLLPLAVCWSTGRMGWPWPARLLGATATVGFVVNEASSIWGGNMLAQFSGEFAYGWGMLMAILFFGFLDRLLHRGGSGWFLAVVLVEMATAMSHGFALLVVGFGSFFHLLLIGGGWQGLWLLMRLHLLSFLLLGFWLMPLLAHHAWTIPIDSSYWPSWQVFWPSNFWWLFWGLPALVAFLFREQQVRMALSPFVAMALTGSIGTILGAQLGLANVRFLPYIQLGLGILLGGALGWWLHSGCRLHCAAKLSRRYHRLAMTMTVFLIMGLVNHWENIITKIPPWSFTFFVGYEGRSQWTTFRKLADHLQGGLEEPRILFEHHPINQDLGSARTLEALPFFGTRPVLEGLYIESSLSSPFIYQMQSEVSRYPSGPLSSFPPRGGTVTATVHHLHELRVDTLILRSAHMKKRFSEDRRFHEDAKIGPFLVVRLTEETSSLVDPLTVPLQARKREGWMDHAYNRFIMDHPYRVRTVYTQAGDVLPAPSPECLGGGTVHLESLTRERLRMTTDRPGCPHLVRMSYHPKWRALTGERIYLVEPFFMLVFPKGPELELAYLPNDADWLGWVFTGVGGMLLLMAWVVCKGFFPGVALFSIKNRGNHAHRTPSTSGYGVLVGLVGLGVVVIMGGQRSSGTLFKGGHALFRQQQYESAATLFDHAVHQRHGWARHAESLFWAAMSWEQIGHHDKAMQRYRDLENTYPAAYYAPEALYRLWLSHAQQGDKERADALRARLTLRYATSVWSRRATEHALQFNDTPG